VDLIVKRADSTDISFSVGVCWWLRSWNLWPISHDGLKIEIKAVVATKTNPKHWVSSPMNVCSRAITRHVTCQVPAPRRFIITSTIKHALQALATSRDQITARLRRGYTECLRRGVGARPRRRNLYGIDFRPSPLPPSGCHRRLALLHHHCRLSDSPSIGSNIVFGSDRPPWWSPSPARNVAIAFHPEATFRLPRGPRSPPDKRASGEKFSAKCDFAAIFCLLLCDEFSTTRAVCLLALASITRSAG
jgi:hypothetical protein